MANNTPSSLPTVILLHGLGRSRFSMSLLGRFLRNHGYPIYNFGYPSRSQSIDQQVARLAEALHKRSLTATPLSFVTHSLGSIILRRFTELHSNDFTLQRAVMLGPPNQGSQTARQASQFALLRFLVGPALLEVQKIAVDRSTEKLEIGVIAGGRGSRRGISPLINADNDAIVSVEETFLPGIRDHLVVKGLHSFLMYQPRVQREVLCFLRNGQFSANKK